MAEREIKGEWIDTWGLFDFKLYKDAFRPSYIWWALSFIGIFVLFFELIKEFITDYWVSPFMAYCPKDNSIADFVLFAFFIIAITFSILRLVKNLIITPNSGILIVTTVLIYKFFFRQSYEYVKFSNPCLERFYYADFFVIGFLLLTANYKRFIKPLKTVRSAYSFLEDVPLTKSYEDAYSRTNYANIICKHISNTSTENSFAIGIMGDWGAGKTDFMLRLEESLIKDTDNIIIKFNPWRSGKSESIIDEFFKELSSALAPYDKSIRKKLKAYSNTILLPSKEIYYRVVQVLLGNILGEDSLQEQYKQINTDIGATGKRLVIFVDDVDRLTGKEIMEVLRIIRNSANFLNTFFVVGIDQKYVVNVLRNTKEFSNEEEYLRKVFQLTVSLPAFSKEIFSSQIRELIITPDMAESDKIKLEGVIKAMSGDRSDFVYSAYPGTRSENILENLIENIRDLKRFCNSFLIGYNILKNEIDVNDWFVLELIRNRNIQLYNQIRNKRLLNFTLDNPDRYILDELVWNTFIKEEGLSDAEVKNLKEALEYLFKIEASKNIRGLGRIKNFYIYFSYQLFNLISFHEYNALLEEDAETIILKFNEWSDNGKGNELHYISHEIDRLENSKDLHKMIVVYCNMNTNSDSYFRIAQRLLFNIEFNEKAYFNNDNSIHKDFLSDILKDDRISYFKRAVLFKPFLEGIIHKNNPESFYVLPKSELQISMHNLFNSYLNNIDHVDYLSINFLSLIWDSVDQSSIIHLYPPALETFKNRLLGSEKLFKDYVGLVLGTYSSYGPDYVAFDPFLPEIFGDWSVFKEQLEQSQFDDDDYKKLRIIILRYIDKFYENNEKAFQIAYPDERQFVLSWIKAKHS